MKRFHTFQKWNNWQSWDSRLQNHWDTNWQECLCLEGYSLWSYWLQWHSNEWDNQNELFRFVVWGLQIKNSSEQSLKIDVLWFTSLIEFSLFFEWLFEIGTESKSTLWWLTQEDKNDKEWMWFVKFIRWKSGIIWFWFSFVTLFIVVLFQRYNHKQNTNLSENVERRMWGKHPSKERKNECMIEWVCNTETVERMW